MIEDERTSVDLQVAITRGFEKNLRLEWELGDVTISELSEMARYFSEEGAKLSARMRNRQIP